MSCMEKGNVMQKDEIKKDIWEAINTLRFSVKIEENAGRTDRIFSALARSIEKQKHRQYI